MEKNRLTLPVFKSSIGSLDWHLPILLNAVGKERIRKTGDVNKELPKLFLKKLQEIDNARNRKPLSIVKKWETLEYSGFSYEGRKSGNLLFQ